RIYDKEKKEWLKRKDANWQQPYFQQNALHPVVCLSWNDAKAYCEWLSKETSETYTLLSEAQREYACRAGSESAYYFGDEAQDLVDYAWYTENSDKQTHPVGQKKANAWGLHDMHGNTWEWVQDWFGEYSAEIQENPGDSDTGSDRVIRGGGWSNSARGCRSAIRHGDDPSNRYSNLGFRLARTGPRPSYTYPDWDKPVAPEVPPEYVSGCSDCLQDGSEGPQMVYLSGGAFMMGDEKSGEEREKPLHDVKLSPFSIAQYPVTFAEYDKYCAAMGADKPKTDWGRDKQPVIQVSWEDAMMYCGWLSKETGRNYTLLTEAQWEYACRAGSETQYCFGDEKEELENYAWYSGGTHQVGEKKPNAWELYDMHGNVWEWVQDWFGEYPAESQENPTGAETGSRRVVRGGGWGNSAHYCRSAVRGRVDPSIHYDDLGFRLARTDPLDFYTYKISGETVKISGAPEILSP
ncbi:formylglycine-generating enzyme family protein, partial [Candidatus Venteria ishoeyi]|uniref:formylglycine-generating enzyme family protein n=1 Tax=Candidatus Venteria ishoeyi TaxID=1899563 RepID=UPI0011B0120A